MGSRGWWLLDTGEGAGVWGVGQAGNGMCKGTEAGQGPWRSAVCAGEGLDGVSAEEPHPLRRPFLLPFGSVAASVYSSEVEALTHIRQQVAEPGRVQMGDAPGML